MTLSSQALSDPGAPAGERIAVVDDDASFLRSVGRLLRVAGYTVETFTSAGKLLASLATSLPRCLVLDVQMPGMTGLQLQDTLTARGYCLPAIFVTALDTPSVRKRARQAGAFGLLLKPFDQSALLTAIHEAIRDPVGSANGTDPVDTRR